jgi:adenylate cyclase
MTSTRQLSVILAADAVGYSRLSEADEAGALAAVGWFRERAAEIVAAHGGRIFSRAGDGIMAELPNARAGVRAALELAETVRARVAHADRPALPVRIGIHLGDVSVEGDGDRLGHDVNLCARIQQLAEPGEVLASRAIADAARNRLEARFERVGRERAKNIAEPIEVFRVNAGERRPRLAVIAGAAAAATLGAVAVGLLIVRGLEGDGMAAVSAPAAASTTTNAALTSIAVLPFVNMSSDPEQEYFSDGLSEELLNQLAQLEGLRVISRTSSFAFKGQNTDVREITTALGVRHVLEGSVRKSGDRLRITAQLVDASDGAHLWSQTYERRLDDVFAIQDEIAVAVADQLSATLGVDAPAPDYGGTASFEAYDHFLRGRAHFVGTNSGGFPAALGEFERATELDPDYAEAWGWLAITLCNLLIFSPPDAAALAAQREAATARVLELAPELPLAQAAKMYLHTDRHEWIEAEEACEMVFAARAEPAVASICSGYLSVTGRVRAATAYREAAQRDDPLSLNAAVLMLRHYVYLDMSEEAAREYERAQGLGTAGYGFDYLLLIQRMHDGAPGEEIAASLEAACARGPSPPHCAQLVAATRSPEQASQLLRELLEEMRRRYPGASLDVGLWAAYLGDVDLALDTIETHFAASGSASQYQSVWFPLLSEARKQPRFTAMVRDVGYDRFWRAIGDWGDYCRPIDDDDFECF